MREELLSEIRKLAAEAGGKPPGSVAFCRQTGIRPSTWCGVYWARWSDALREAGFEPNPRNEKLDESYLLTKLAESCRHYRKFPGAMELRLYKRVDSSFPTVNTITKHFGSLFLVPARLAEWADTRAEWADVAALLALHVTDESRARKICRDGWVYLIRSGAHYKVGRSDNLEQRLKRIGVALPESAILVHTIRTDDAPGIEAYWHRRFAERRANGEWFALRRTDVSAFRKRRFQ